MHELGIVCEIVKLIDEIKDEQSLTTIAAISLQIGEFSDVIPDYLTECFNVVKKDTYLENTQMNIEVLPAKARCRDCLAEYEMTKNSRQCPKCKSSNYSIISGHEFVIKEIEAK